MTYNVVLKNSDKIAFDAVITGVSLICQIPIIQAEQLATLTHYRGSITVRENLDHTTADKYVDLFDKLGLPAVVEAIEV